MAIQLNQRDYLIFQLLVEHTVLLEKHIAWFVAHEEKPVLIRDRLRKLFYLDYLLCQRYDNKLSWWTTPTKPLVYMLAPLAASMAGSKTPNIDTSDTNQQKKYLEIANIRMIFLIAQTKGIVQNFKWTTCGSANNGYILDAVISCDSKSASYNLGLLCHPVIDRDLLAKIEKEMIEKKITNIMIVCGDQTHQVDLQKLLTGSKILSDKTVFAVHQDLYKNGIDKVLWLSATRQPVKFLGQSNTISVTAPGPGQSQIFTDVHAA